MSIALHAVITILAALITGAIYALLSNVHWVKKLLCRPFGIQPGDQESTFSAATLMRLMLIPVALSVFMLWMILHSTDYSGFSGWLDNLVTVARTFSMEENTAALMDENTYGVLNTWEKVWVSFVMAVAPMLTLTTAVSFFRLPRFWAMLLSGRRVLIFSDANPHAIQYASVLSQEKNGKPHVVFCCEEGAAVNVDVGKALLLKRDITNLRIFKFIRKRVHFYLISDNENRVMKQAVALKDKYLPYGSRIYCVSNGLLNEHAVDEINRSLPEQPGKDYDCYGVDVIDEKIRVVYQNLYTNPLIEKEFLSIPKEEPIIEEKAPAAMENAPDTSAAEKTEPFSETETLLAGRKKVIRVLVLGGGRVGSAVARTMLWYCQLPGYRVEVVVADKEKEKTVRRRVFRNNHDFEQLMKLVGYENQARLLVCAEKDLQTSDLEEILKEKTYHKIFVCAGDDNRNYHMALQVRRYYLRHPQPWGCPEIRAVIWDDTMTELVGKDTYAPLQGVDDGKDDIYGKQYTCNDEKIGRQNRCCRVQLLGSMTETLVGIEELLEEALQYHTFYKQWYQQKENAKPVFIRSLIDNKKEVIDLTRFSYITGTKSDERSNLALALHSRVVYQWVLWKDEMSKLEKQQDDKKWVGRMQEIALNEHARWCIFKLLEGDSPAILNEESAQAWPKEEELKTFNTALEDRLIQKESKKGRDWDPVRSFHTGLLSWRAVKDKMKEIETVSKENEAQLLAKQNAEPQAVRYRYWKSQLGTDDAFAQFAYLMEYKKQLEHKDGTKQADDEIDRKIAELFPVTESQPGGVSAPA
ncbi:MAG: hypothetical protein IJB69_07900 [Clostridia bacterium]|nr:hypothetical protein [Clostridia bacterium]